MRKRVFTILQYVFFLGLAIFLVWYSLKPVLADDNWGMYKKSLKAARFWLLIPVFAILSTSHIARAKRWQLLMEPLVGHQPRFANTFFAVMIGYFINLFLPRAGEVLKCTIMARYEKVPADKLVGTIVAERAMDVVCLLIVFLIAFGWNYDILGDYTKATFTKLFAGKDGGVSTTKILILFLIAIFFMALVYWLKKQKSENKILLKIKSIVNGIGDGLTSVRHLKNRPAFFFYTFLIWGMYVLGTVVGFYALKETSGLGFQEAFPALAFGSIGMVLTPGGVGAYAIFFGEVLPFFNVDKGFAVLNGHLQWVGQFIVVVLVGGISLIAIPIYNSSNIAKTKL